MADVHRDPLDWLECVQEPDAAGSDQKTKVVEVESGAATKTPDNKREGVVAMATAMAADLPPLDVSGANSPRTRVGRGLESIGGMTADTFQRISTAVGGVVKSPVVLMAKVGGLASPRAASLASSPRTPLEERVFQLEIQMKSFEEKYDSRTVVTELNLSPRSLKEKPRVSRSLLQEMETEGTLVKRVQMLEDRLNERMESIEKALSSIQSQFAYVDFSKLESVAGYERQESVSGEPQYYDAEQQSDNFEALETLERKSFEDMGAGAYVAPGEDTGSSPTLEETPVKETSAAAPSTAEPVEPVQELDAGKSGDVSLEPQLASTSVESKEALAREPMDAAAPSAGPAESVQELDAGKSGDVSLEPQLASTSVESKEAFGEEPMEATEPSAEAREPVQELDAGKSADVLEPQLASTSVESKEILVREPMEAAAPSAGPAETVQELDAGKSGDVSLEPQLASTSVESKAAFVEPMEAAAPIVEAVEPVQELDAGKGADILEPQVASTSVESKEALLKEPMEAAASSGEPAGSVHGNGGGTLPASSDRQLAHTLEDLHEVFVTEPSAAAASAKFLEIARADTAEKRSNALAFSEPQSASLPEEPQEAFAEEPSAPVPVANSEELAQEDSPYRTGAVIAAAESSSPPTFEALQEDFVKEPLAGAPNAKPAQEMATQEDSDMALASSQPQVAYKFVEEPWAATPSANFEEPAQEDAAEKIGTMTAAAESPLASSLEEREEDSAKEPLAAAPSAELAQELATNEDSEMALASSEPQVASKFVEEPWAAASSANFEESADEDAADKSGTMIAATGSLLASSLEEPQKDFMKESLAAAPSAAPAQELATQEGSDVALASSKPQVASKFVEEPSAAVPSANFEEPAQGDAPDKSGTMTAAAESPLASSLEEPEEDAVKEPLAAASSAGRTQELATNEDSDMALASFEPQVASKFVEEPSAAVRSTTFEEPAQEDAAEKTGTITAGAASPLVASLEEPQEDSVKEPLAESPSAEPAQELATNEDSDMALASSQPQGASKFVEEPSAAVPSANFEESADEDAAEKTGTMIAAAGSPLASSLEEPQEGFVKDSLAAAPSAEPAQELETNEGSDVALASSEPQVASKFLEEPSAAVTSANFEEPAHEDAADKSGTMTAAAESPLSSSFEAPQKDFVKESLAVAPSAGSAQEPSSQEDSGGHSDMALASSEPQVASKFLEEPSAGIPSANFEEPARENAADKSGTMIAAVESPLASSFEEPQEDFVKESLAAALSAKPAQEPTTQEDSDRALASSEPQVASKFLEEPSAAAPSASFEKPGQKDAADKSATMIAAVESPLVSSLEEPQDDYVKESLAAGASAKFLEPAGEDDSGNSAIAFASLEAQSASNLEEPQEAFVKEPSGTSVQLEEPAQEESGNVLRAAESTLTSKMEESQNGPVEEGNHAPKETEYKLAEDVKVPDEHIKSIEEAFPRSQINLVRVGSDKLKPESLAAEDSDDRLESEQSGEEFFDAEQGSGHLEPWESVEQKSFEESAVGPDEPGEATGINAVAQKSFVKELLVPAPSAEPAQEPEQAPAKAEQDSAQEHEHEPAQEHGQEPEQQPAQEPGQEPGQEPTQEPEQQPTQEHGQESAQEPAREPGQEPGQEPTQEPEQQPTQEHGQEPAQEPEQLTEELTQEPTQEHRQEPAQEPAQEPEQEPIQEPTQEHGQEPAQENPAGKSGTALPGPNKPGEAIEYNAQEQEQEIFANYFPTEPFETASSVEPAQELAQIPEQQSEQQPAQEPAQEDLAGKSGMALASSEPQVPAKFEESQELLAEESLAAVPSAKFEEPAQANAADESGTRDLPLTSKAEEPQIDTIGSPEESLSSAEFLESGNSEPVESLEQKSLDEIGVAVDTPGTSSTPQEALEKEPLTAAPTTEPVQGHDAGKSDNVYTSLEPQLASTSEELKEEVVNEPMEPASSSESTVPAQGGDNGLSGTILASSEPQLTSTLQEPQEAFVTEPSAAAELASNSVELEESLAEEPSAFTPSAKLAQEGVADKSSTGLVAAEESPLTSIVEEPQNDSVSSLVEGKHGQNEADHKSTEDVKIPAGPIEEAFPRNQSDLAHAELKPEAAQDTAERQESLSREKFHDADQGSFLAFGAASIESKEAFEREPLAAAKLLEISEVEGVGKSGTVLEDSPVTSIVEETQKPLAEEPLTAVSSSAKLVEDDHARKRGFARSSSEPQFAYKLEEHRKALAKESSVAAPSALKFEEHAQEDFADMQCLPFRILGEGKHPRKESELKLVEDVKSPAGKPEAATSYVLEPKPSRSKEKKKKEKKDRRQDAIAEEKDRRHSLGLGEMIRKSSLRREEKDSKYSPGAEEKHKQPFRQWRDRLRHAFSVNKDS